MIEIEQPKTKTKEIQTYNPLIKHQTSGHVKTQRIVFNEEFTRIDFIYFPPSYYVNGGWVNIRPTCFIRAIGSDRKLVLVQAINIPLAPKLHIFKSTKDCLSYTLYFPALPKGTTQIDIIEAEGPGGNWFNFYGVTLERVRSERIIVNGNN